MDAVLLTQERRTEMRPRVETVLWRGLESTLDDAEIVVGSREQLPRGAKPFVVIDGSKTLAARPSRKGIRLLYYSSRSMKDYIITTRAQALVFPWNGEEGEDPFKGRPPAIGDAVKFAAGEHRYGADLGSVAEAVVQSVRMTLDSYRAPFGMSVVGVLGVKEPGYDNVLRYLYFPWRCEFYALSK